jgi:hypothetical protein
VLTDANDNRMVFTSEFQIDERLMQFQAIVVSQTRPAIASIRNTALQLSERSNPSPEMPIRVEEISLQKVPITILRARAKSELGEMLIANSRLAA